jgi:hypothetical protein
MVMMMMMMMMVRILIYSMRILMDVDDTAFIPATGP